MIEKLINNCCHFIVNMKLTKELFAIPNKEKYLLYAPTKGSVLEVNSSTIGLLQTIQGGEIPSGREEIMDRLRKKGILEEDEASKATGRSSEKSYFDASITLFPTSECNLRCIYCYASAGDIHENMSLDTAKSALDFIVDRAAKKRKKNVSLGFHGGGEPLYNFRLVRDIIEYAQKETENKHLDLRVSAATNGVFDDKKLEWVIKNMKRLSLSLDGPEDIQNLQRPMKDGSPSFGRVMETLKSLESVKFDYGIRSTITEYNVSRMVEMVHFFSENTTQKSFHFEPLFECGRCKKTAAKEPDPVVFLENMIRAKEEAEKLGVEIYYSGGKLGGAMHTFCAASGRNFYVTPQGYVSSCLEVTNDKDPRAKIFFYGKFDNGKLRIQKNRLRLLKSRVVENIPHCGDCFAKFSCCGDCLAKIHTQSGDMFDTSNNRRCEVNRGLLLHEINRKLEENGK
jgi:uncharacterized protein